MWRSSGRGGKVFVSSVDRCNTASHTRESGSGEELPGGKEKTLVVMDPSAPRHTSSEFFHSVLSGSKAFKVKGFEVILMSTYTLGKRREIFHDLTVDAQ